MEKRDIFNALFYKRGYYDVEQDNLGTMAYTWIKDLNSCVEFVNKKCAKPPRIIVGLLHNPSMGAAADKFEDTYYIAIYNGLIAVLLPLFNRMLTSPNILVDFGDCSQEQVQKIDAPFLVNGAETVIGEYTRINDPTRRALVGFLMQWVLRYIVLHENAHIIHGHVDYVYSRKSQAEWQSIEHAQWQNIDPLSSQNSRLDPLLSMPRI